MKHNGSFDDLQAIVKAVGFNIEFAGSKGNALQIRTKPAWPDPKYPGHPRI